MRKIYLILAALLCGMAMNAATVYCKMTHEWWTKDGAAVAAHMWGGSSATTWPGIRMTPVSGEANVWSIETGDNTNIIFVRVNGSGDVTDWGAKTKDLTIPTDGKNLFTITTSSEAWGDPGCDGEWSVYNGQGGNGDNPGGQGGQGNAGQYDYYLRGFFNGVDTQVPTAEEKFEGGILEDFTFTGNDGNGYFFVMRCDQGAVVGVDYMLEAYQSGGTNVTLKNKEQTGAAQKWGIPAGTVTFYLYDNGDGTLELSTQPMPGKTLVGGGQGVENTFVNEKAHKMIIDGQLRIIRGDKTFDATGRQL